MTKLMTTAQVYRMAGVENELLDHIKSRKLRYFGQVMRQSHDNNQSINQSLFVSGKKNPYHPSLKE